LDATQIRAASSVVKELLGPVTIKRMADIGPAAEALRDIAFSMAGLRTATCSNIASKTPMVDGKGANLASEVLGWRKPSERWWSRPRLALTSPLVIACRYESDPFWCNQMGIYTQQRNSQLAALDLADFFDRAMTTAAIVVPIHLPYGQIGAVSFPTPQQERTDLSREFAEFGEMLGLCAHRFVTSYVKVMEKPHNICSDVRLSKRENECLRWAAVGKTDSEIALILSRSCATIRFHIHNAALKLNAVNRSQAVFKAGQLGYLGLIN
jgi:LuxR family quorum-sensing system transcriptional regulator CciR